MVPNAVTAGHCQIQLRPGGTVTSLLLVDPGQSPDLSLKVVASYSNCQ